MKSIESEKLARMLFKGPFLFRDKTWGTSVPRKAGVTKEDLLASMLELDKRLENDGLASFLGTVFSYLRELYAYAYESGGFFEPEAEARYIEIRRR